jgi:ribosomal-protein-alanine N-acetyltransferase
LREDNRAWLDPWDATLPDDAQSAPAGFRQYVHRALRQAREGRTLPWVIELDGTLVGQMTISAISRGAALSGSAGYWIGESYAGRGLAPLALALAFDHAVGAAGLHRIEVAIRPENGPSLRVVEKLWFREEGLRPSFLHVNGQWRDHRVFALTREEVPGGLLSRWNAMGRPAGGPAVTGPDWASNLPA